MPSVSYPSDGNDVCFGVEETSFWFRHRNRVILAAVRNFPPPGRVILDVGGGNGFVTRALQDEGLGVVLIEPNVQGARNAIRRGVRHAVSGGVEATRSERVGAIALFDVIEHLEDDVAFVEELTRGMPGGTRLYATVPAFQALWSGDDDAAGHFRRYRLDAIERTLQRAGFEIDYATYFFSLLPAPILLFRVLPWRAGLRPRPTNAQIATEHGSRAGAAVERALAWEVERIRARRRIPIGSSCLVVATLRIRAQ